MEYDQNGEECSPDNPRQARVRSGIVQSWESGIARVQIFENASCGTCSAKSSCAAANFSETGAIIKVPYEQPLTVGQRVRLEMSQKASSGAILAFILPLVLVGGVLALVFKLGGTDLQASLTALGGIALWLGGLWLFRKRMQKSYGLQLIQ